MTRHILTSQQGPQRWVTRWIEPGDPRIFHLTYWPGPPYPTVEIFSTDATGFTTLDYHVADLVLTQQEWRSAVIDPTSLMTEVMLT